MTSRPPDPNVSLRRPLVLHLATSDMALRFLLVDQLNYLRTAGFEVAAAARDTGWLTEVRAAGVPAFHIPFTRRITPAQDLVAFQVAVRLMRALRPDIVHTHTPKASLLGQYAALLAGVRDRVHTIHGLYRLDAKPRQKRAHLAFERLTLTAASRVLSQSSEDVNTCVTERLCNPSKVSYLGNGIRLSDFRPPSDAERDSVRSELGLSTHTRVLLFVGRLVAEKGLHDLFAAMRAIRQRCTDIRLLVVGATDTEKSDAVTPGHADDAGVGDLCTFLGHRSDVARIYWAADALVHPSHREGVPRVPMEAMASGLPVVATDIRGCREVVVSQQTGILVPARQPAALCNAVVNLLENDVLRSEMATRARERALSSFDQTVVFQRVAATYHDLLRARSAQHTETRH